MLIFALFEKGHNNDVRIVVVHNHEILISVEGKNRKSLNVVRLYFTDVIDADVQFLLLCTWFFRYLCWVTI